MGAAVGFNTQNASFESGRDPEKHPRCYYWTGRSHVPEHPAFELVLDLLRRFRARAVHLVHIHRQYLRACVIPAARQTQGSALMVGFSHGRAIQTLRV